MNRKQLFTTGLRWIGIVTAASMALNSCVTSASLAFSGTKGLEMGNCILNRMDDHGTRDNLSGLTIPYAFNMTMLRLAGIENNQPFPNVARRIAG